MAADEFPFARSEMSKAFCRRVREAVVLFGDKSPEEACDLIRRFWHYLDDIEEDVFLYREPPYYYAMCILHHPVLGDDRLDWIRDDRLWPPPQGWETV